MLTGASAALRSRLQALPWMVLEQLALDAHLDSGRLVAASSARRIAEQLKVDPGSVAAALRVLRRADIVDLVRPGTSRSRFDLASYLLGETPGLLVLRAGAPPQPTGGDLLSPRPSGAAMRSQGGAVPTSELDGVPVNAAGLHQSEAQPETGATRPVRSDRRRPLPVEPEAQPDHKLTWRSGS